MRVPFLEVNQPIGSFYITKIRADLLALITDTIRRSEKPGAVQRDLSIKRVNEISDYCSDSDATFPTPIIVSIYEDADVKIKNGQFEFSNTEKIGSIIDGQHRIEGLIKSTNIHKFDLLVVFMFNLTEEERAYVFSIINSKQTRVSMSLIYDLFELSKNRSPQKTCHEIARSMNSNFESPFYNRLKMLGKKSPDQKFASLSQGSFVKYSLNLISKKPDEDFRLLKAGNTIRDFEDLPLRKYFILGDDHFLNKIFLNNFDGLRATFELEWDNPDDYILSKTTGFAAVIKSFNHLYNLGDGIDDLSKDFFASCYQKFRDYLKSRKLKLTSDHFPSNAQQQSRLAKMIIESQRTI